MDNACENERKARPDEVPCNIYTPDPKADVPHAHNARRWRVCVGESIAVGRG